MTKLVLAVVLLAVAGCGGSDSPPDTLACHTTSDLGLIACSSNARAILTCDDVAGRPDTTVQPCPAGTHCGACFHGIITCCGD